MYIQVHVYIVTSKHCVATLIHLRTPCIYVCIYISGTAPAINGMATVTVNGLQCEVTYTIIAGGTLNGDLVGPRSSHGTITAGSCPSSRLSELYTYLQTYIYM